MENDGISLKRKKHLILATLYKSPCSIHEKNLLIDVVSEEYGEFQDAIRRDIKSIAQTIDKNAEAISDRIAEIVTLLESANRNK